MKAEPAAQARLLDLQELDTELQRLDHRIRNLPEAAEAAALKERVEELDSELITTQTKVSDTERRQRKAERDVEQVRDRADRNARRLESGQITNAKELQNLQSEIDSLARRQSELEEIVLEVMEQAEELNGEVTRLSTLHEEAVVEHTEAVTHRDTVAAGVSGTALASPRTENESPPRSPPTCWPCITSCVTSTTMWEPHRCVMAAVRGASSR